MRETSKSEGDVAWLFNEDGETEKNERSAEVVTKGMGENKCTKGFFKRGWVFVLMKNKSFSFIDI